MPIALYAKKLLVVIDHLSHWRSLLASLDRSRRLRVARYADDIAATLARAAVWAKVLEEHETDLKATRALIREIGRIEGYLESIFDVLSDHLDGRKLAGVKRRLYALSLLRDGAPPALPTAAASARINQLIAAEGYLRALADGLRV